METVSGINVIILPTQEIKERVYKWSEEIARKYPVKFVLDGLHYFPHLTLYQTNFPEKNFSVIEKTVGEIAQNLKPFTISFKTLLPYVNFIFYHAIKTPEIESLHLQMIDSLSPLRDAGYTHPQDLQNFPPNIARNISQYGYALAKNDFLPHITVSRCNTEMEAEKAIQLCSPKRFTMNVDSLAIGNINHDGTVSHIYKTIPFGKLS
jgi:2'-5' RNA ligase